MEPVTAIQNLLKVNRQAAAILIAGMAVVAAAAILTTWTVDIDTALYVGISIAGAGLLLTFASFILHDELLKRVIAWATTLLIFTYMGAILISVILPGLTPLPPAPCLVQVWQPCDEVLDAVAVRTAPEIDIKAPPSGGDDGAAGEGVGSAAGEGVDAAASGAFDAVSVETKESFRVFIQFAGYRREDIQDLASTLAESGWNVQGADAGGERISTAAGLAEVRYRGEEQAQAASALAAEIEATGVKASVSTKQLPIVGAGILEVWIGL